MSTPKTLDNTSAILGLSSDLNKAAATKTRKKMLMVLGGAAAAFVLLRKKLRKLL